MRLRQCGPFPWAKAHATIAGIVFSMFTTATAFVMEMPWWLIAIMALSGFMVGYLVCYFDDGTHDGPR